MGKMSELHIKMQDEVNYCLHCERPIIDDLGVVHRECEIEYYSFYLKP